MKVHILLVDDEESIRNLVSRYLVKRGYEVTTASSCEEASRLVDEIEPTVVILDIVLEDGDGLDLLADFKARHPDLPVIMLTGLGFEDDLLAQARENGADGFASKNLLVQTLLIEIHRVLRPREVA